MGDEQGQRGSGAERSAARHPSAAAGSALTAPTAPTAPTTLNALHDEALLDRLEGDAELDRVARALADPARRFALELLVVGGASAGDLAASLSDTFGISTARASQHLQLLAKAELVDVTADGPWRWYSLPRTVGRPLRDWLRGLERSY
ncbi:helix-turn-helix domain-containing protein [Demequina sp. TTPB684]|uniref:ArsR/SmtB family transcription factor n=1 Tax=unclassified Demequina TaxID=2620311 RepID=UPI001CF18E4C|nr:metalloregulator ArsR/SmtB family transcription factor [Demequina sp. TMPB413]MCB2412680.1 helix-turn-helix domain-containing protein [Demequina sp. TTPB684]UPU87679.1 helix-turn-helix domain-containing protein [Demequina sp. TMPB413]